MLPKPPSLPPRRRPSRSRPSYGGKEVELRAKRTALADCQEAEADKLRLRRAATRERYEEAMETYRRDED
jgi:hypothetical protein